MKATQYKCVLRDHLKQDSEFSSLSSSGKQFQRVGALTAKALWPLVFSLDRGIVNRSTSEEFKLQATGCWVMNQLR